MLNSVVKISMMSVKYFEYYTIILRGAVFSWTHCRWLYLIWCHCIQCILEVTDVCSL